MRAFIRFLIVIIVVPIVCAVRITRLHVPGDASDEAHLDCKYDLESDQLYDVKWYKDNQQFFRCMPSGEVMTFKVEGVTILHSKYAPLGSCPVTLMMLTTKSAGMYRCEVSTEGPAFRTDVSSSVLRRIETSRRIQRPIDNNEVTPQQSNITPTREATLSQVLLICFIINMLNY